MNIRKRDRVLAELISNCFRAFRADDIPSVGINYLITLFKSDKEEINDIVMELVSKDWLELGTYNDLDNSFTYMVSSQGVERITAMLKDAIQAKQNASEMAKKLFGDIKVNVPLTDLDYCVRYSSLDDMMEAYQNNIRRILANSK